MNFSSGEAAWEETKPYTAMLRQYQAAADKLAVRQQGLKSELRQMQDCKGNTPESAHAQKVLEDRLQLLHNEYYELTDVMRQIRRYAAMEVQ